METGPGLPKLEEAALLVTENTGESPGWLPSPWPAGPRGRLLVLWRKEPGNTT